MVEKVEIYDEYITNMEWLKEIKKICETKISVRPDYNAEEGAKKKKTEEQMTKLLWSVMTEIDELELQSEHTKSINQLLTMQKKACLQDIIRVSDTQSIIQIMLSGPSGNKSFSKYVKI